MLCLYGKSLPFIFGVLFLLLTACGAEFETSTIGSFDDAVNAGLIMAFERAEATAALPRYAPVFLDTRVSTRNIVFSIEFFRHYDLPFEMENLSFRQFYVSEGDMVREGDILASGFYEPTDIEIARHRRAVNDLRQMETDFRDERYRRRIEIQDLEREVDTAVATARERAIINLAIRELEYEQFITQTQRAIQNARESIADTEFLFAAEYITAPFDGLITSIAAIREGTTIAENRVIVSIADVDTVFFNVPGPGAHIFRYGDIVPISLAGEEFYAKVASDPFAGGFRGAGANFILRPLSYEGIANALYRLEGNWTQLRRYDGRRAYPTQNMYGESIWLPFAAINTVLVTILELPVETYYVIIYDDGVFRQRFITPGLYISGQYQHVLSGVEPGQYVVIAGGAR